MSLPNGQENWHAQITDSARRMKVLVVYCHPVETSYNAAIHKVAVETLKRRGHEVEDVDLYAEGFNPVISREERLVYHDLTKNQRGVEKYVAQLRRAEALVFVYPTWTYGFPAMLKGWFDRVWQAKVAFDVKDGVFQVHTMSHINRFAAISSHGSPKLFIDYIIGNPGRRVLSPGLELQLAPRSKFLWRAFYGVDSLPRPQIEKDMQRFETALTRFLR